MESNVIEKNSKKNENISIDELLKIPKDAPNPYIVLQKIRMCGYY